MSFITVFGTPFVLWLVVGIAFVIGGVLVAELGFGRTRTHRDTSSPSNVAPGKADGPDTGGTK